MQGPPQNVGSALDRDPFLQKRIAVSLLCIGRIFCGEPASTSPENALAARGAAYSPLISPASISIRLKRRASAPLLQR
jgi:hypothetical protein